MNLDRLHQELILIFHCNCNVMILIVNISSLNNNLHFPVLVPFVEFLIVYVLPEIFDCSCCWAYTSEIEVA